MKEEFLLNGKFYTVVPGPRLATITVLMPQVKARETRHPFVCHDWQNLGRNRAAPVPGSRLPPE